MENETNKGMNPMVLGLVAIVVVAVLAVGVFVLRPSTPATETMVPQPTVASTAGEAMIAKESTYKDGSYEVVGMYTSPGGEEELGVELTLVNNIITDSEVTVKATRPISVKMQNDFAQHYKTLVVGKSIDEVALTKVSGSSLTPKGFNDALEKVKVEAAS